MKKKIIFVSNSISGGGAEDSTFRVYEQLRNRGLNIKLCVLNSDTQDQIPKDVLRFYRKWNSGIISTFRCFVEFNKMIKKEKPDLLVAHCELPEMFSALLLRSFPNIIVVEHTSRPWFGRRKLGLIVRLCLKFKKARWVTVNSSSPPIWLGNLAPIHIPNPVSVSGLNPNHKSEEPIVFIGRLRKEKRPDWAIEAAIQNNLPIAIYGVGEELESLQSKYSENSALVKFKGYVNNPWWKIGSSALVIVPSEFEGDGLVVVEGILNGNPILLADNSDLRRFQLSENQYFKSKDKLLEKVSAAVASNFTSYLPSADVRTKIGRQRNLDFIAERWEEILQ